MARWPPPSKCVTKEGALWKTRDVLDVTLSSRSAQAHRGRLVDSGTLRNSLRNEAQKQRYGCGALKVGPPKMGQRLSCWFAFNTNHFLFIFFTGGESTKSKQIARWYPQPWNFLELSGTLPERAQGSKWPGVKIQNPVSPQWTGPIQSNHSTRF